jgi:transketolase
MMHLQLQGKLRKKILEMHFGANSGHIGCSLSCIDILLSILKYKNEEDSFILSKGHAASALYAVLNELGKIPNEDMDTFYKDATKLSAHPAPLKYPDITFATGSLGHGLPLAVGVAKAMKIKKTNAFSYVLMSDGETNEGTSWEAAHFAINNKLDNLVVFIDKNGLQGFATTQEVLGDTASMNLWQMAGFDVLEVDGHSIEQVLNAKEELIAKKNQRPKLIIANTIKGKGVSFMEGRLEWHYHPMNEKQFDEALAQIKNDYQL